MKKAVKILTFIFILLVLIISVFAVSDKNELKLKNKVDKGGKFDIEYEGVGGKIKFKNVEGSPLDLKIKNPKSSKIKFSTKALYARMNSSSNFSAELVLEKTSFVNSIFYCDENLWLGECQSGWDETNIVFVDNGTHIIFNVTHFSTYAGGYVVVDINETTGTNSQTITIDEEISLTNVTLWTYTNNPSSNQDMLYSIDIDSEGIYLGGYNASGNVWWHVQKVNLSTGENIWNYTSNPSSNVDIIYSIAVDSTGVYAGGRSDPLWYNWRVEKINLSTGENIWIQNINPGDSNDQIYSVAVDSTGLYVGGTDSSFGNLGWRVDKLNLTNGEQIWNYTTDPTIGHDYLKSIAVDSSGVYLGGAPGGPS